MYTYVYVYIYTHIYVRVYVYACEHMEIDTAYCAAEDLEGWLQVPCASGAPFLLWGV